jgi:hypothetical protein
MNWISPSSAVQCLKMQKTSSVRNIFFPFSFFLFIFFSFVTDADRRDNLSKHVFESSSSLILRCTGILSISAIADIDGDSAADNKEFDSDDEVEGREFDRNYAADITTCKWFSNVDFVVENGPRGLLIDETSDKKKSGQKRVSMLGGLSTIVDLTTGRPVILRQGRGVLDVDDVQT